MIDRRKFLGRAAGASASLALAPGLLRALQDSGATLYQQPAGRFIQRAIPSTGEMLPALGLSFSNHPSCSDHAALTQVLKSFHEGGGRVYDVMHVNPTNEQFHIDAATQLGIQSKLFWSTRATPGNVAPEPGGVSEHVGALLSKMNTPKIDLVMLPVASDAATIAALKAEKKAGRVRYIGVQTIIAANQAAQLEAIMRNEPIDFIGVDYDVSNRGVEEVILPLAQQRKIAVMVFFPFNNAHGLSCTGGTTLFTRVAGKAVPEWAAEFDAKTWSQFFTKYVLSHPAVTVVRTGTTKPEHMLDNMGGGIGRLPNEAMRKRMAELVDALPPAPPPTPPGPQGPPPVDVPVATLDKYVSEWKTPGGMLVTFRREGPKLFVKPGPNPEVPLIPRSQTRFQDPRGPIFEFKVDAQGNVTGLSLDQGNPAQILQLVRQ